MSQLGYEKWSEQMQQPTRGFLGIEEKRVCSRRRDPVTWWLPKTQIWKAPHAAHARRAETKDSHESQVTPNRKKRTCATIQESHAEERLAMQQTLTVAKTNRTAAR